MGCWSGRARQRDREKQGAPYEGDDTYYLVQAATGLILQILGE